MMSTLISEVEKEQREEPSSWGTGENINLLEATVKGEGNIKKGKVKRLFKNTELRAYMFLGEVIDVETG